MLYPPAEVERLQQLYPSLSGGHAVGRRRLHHLGAQPHISEHQQSPDGKPAPEPRMHTHTKHLLWVNRGRHTQTHVRRDTLIHIVMTVIYAANNETPQTEALLFQPRVGLWRHTVGSRKLLQTRELQSAPRTLVSCWEASRSRTSHPASVLGNTAGQREGRDKFRCRMMRWSWK